ncbi:MAG: nicotinate-nucleotide adenylyltransferase [Methylococcales symbiont of Hymedesmia sp. n. MRB-2018]|nr:MAG: nicotinate-nucleotide adenylyltransferase [Methylococcales symbiont of Hymedesmia sp. n. MRB-2018]
MIGIYGGTFDPIHFGHLRTALEVKECFCLDEIRLLPCAQPALKESPDTASDKRLKMIELAIQDQESLRVDRRELNRPGISYMVDTLRSIRNEISNTSLLLFMGTDAFKDIASWQQWQSLFDYAHIIVITRPNYQQQPLGKFLSLKLTQNKEDLTKKPTGFLFFQTVTQLDISATAIRELIANNKNPAYLLPKQVIDYIKVHKLYTDPTS